MRRAPGSGRYLGTVIGIPILVVGLGLVLVASAWDQLPPVVASHWGPDGVDGTQDRLAFTVTASAITLGICLLLGAFGWLLPPDGRRVIVAVVGGLGGFLATL